MRDKIKILVVEPMKPCEVREIPDTLEAMQALVGGYIQAVYPFQEEVAVICNEEGRNLDLPYNRPLMDESGLPYDIVCGTFFMAGVSGEHFVSLRACLKSSNEDGNEGKRENLSRNIKFAFTIFPKSAEFVEPAEKTLYHPAAWQNDKLV